MYCILLYIAAQLQGAAGSWGGATTSTSFDVKKKILVIATFTLSRTHRSASVLNETDETHYAPCRPEYCEHDVRLNTLVCSVSLK